MFSFTQNPHHRASHSFAILFHPDWIWTLNSFHSSSSFVLSGFSREKKKFSLNTYLHKGLWIGWRFNFFVLVGIKDIKDTSVGIEWNGIVHIQMCSMYSVHLHLHCDVC